MGPALSPGAVGQEMAACAVLGGVLGAARAVLPTRGRAAFLPDLLFVGCVLMALQGYAVSQSQAGQLRGYMALAAFCAAGAVQAALRPLFAAAEAFAGKLLLGPVRLAARCMGVKRCHQPHIIAVVAPDLAQIVSERLSARKMLLPA